MRKYAFLILALLLASASCIAVANTWTGSLTGSSLTSSPPNGKSQDWGKQTITITWTVTQNGSLFNYKYVLNVGDGFGISHFILETSSNFTSSSYSSGPTLLLDDYGIAPSNPGLTQTIHGAKVEDLSGEQTWTIEFTSSHVPVWGDFYAKGGKTSYVYNEALNSSFDPYDYIWKTPVNTGKYLTHIAVPDSRKLFVPEASTFAAFGSALALMVPGMIRFRKRR